MYEYCKSLILLTFYLEATTAQISLSWAQLTDFLELDVALDTI